MQSVSVPASLVDAGVQVISGDAHSLTYRQGDRAVTADLVFADRVSSPGSVLDRIRGRPGHRVLVICEAISSEARSALLAEACVDLSVTSTGELVLSGRTYRAPAVGGPHPWTRERSWRRRAAERVCVLTDVHLRQTDLAAALAVTQQAVSKMVEKEPLSPTPMGVDERRKLLAELAVLPADGGLVETYWYGTDPVTVQVRNAIRLGEELTVQVLGGGEVAADVLSPWRVPRTGLVYAEELVDLTAFDLVESTPEEATLTVRVPADPTVWTTAAWWQQIDDARHRDIPTVDPVVVLQDMSAGADTGDGAPQRLGEWIVHR
ncbi:hypothetical protein [Mycolicibacterium sp.]|uniref:hypothetical protein n=1 Tax=Mycolicibacterium sp. TaxID=2320850 RepID=UPI003560DA7E